MPIGWAPDGLPLVLNVRRRVDLGPTILSRLGVTTKNVPRIVADAIGELERSVDVMSKERGIEGRRYRTFAPVSRLFGSTLLARVLGATSPAAPQTDAYLGSQERIPATCCGVVTPDFAEVLDALEDVPHLTVPIDGGAPRVERKNGEERPFESESLAAFPSARWVATIDNERLHGRFDRGLTDAVRRATSLAWEIREADVAAKIVELGNALRERHAQGIVHADLKPANVLVTANGVKAFDGLDLREGQLSAAATPGWAAPEQVIAKPVSPATDVYALGLLAARVFGAVVYGEERSFLLPTGRTNRHRVTVLADVRAFIDPREDIRPSVRRAREQFVARCLSFEPEARPAHAGVFAEDFAGLVAEQPPTGTKGIGGGPGELRRAVSIDGRLQPSWVIDDGAW